jgi:hypothetical protein
MAFQGPLPAVDEKSILQAESILALQAALPLRDYKFRDERADDFGVDGSIELLANGSATNIRAQVQLKARSNTDIGTSGSISVQIETSNLNYLLNGLCPLYVLYRPEQKELRFAFAQDEWNRIEQTNPAWREQGKIVVHFRNVLTEKELPALWNRIAQEARLQREVRERVANLRTATGRVIIDPKTLQTADSQQLLKMLASLGQELTNSGLAKLVIESATAISPSEFASAPGAALALAYAHFHLAHYHDASAVLRRLLLTDPALDVNSKALLDILFLSVKRMLGVIDQDQYEQELQQWSVGAPAELLVQQEIADAWSLYRKTMASGISTPEHEKACIHLNEVLERGQRIGGPLVWHYVELQKLWLSGFEIADSRIDAEALSGFAQFAPGGAHHARVKQREVEAIATQWQQRLRKLLDETRETAPQVHCEAQLLQVQATLGHAMHRQLAAQAGYGPKVLATETDSIFAAIEEGLRLARTLDNRELELSALQLQARALDIFERADDATRLATEAMKIANLCGCTIHGRQLREFLDGKDRAAARALELKQVESLSEEEILRKADESQLLYRATLELDAFQLPQHRLPNIVRSLQCQQRLAIERRDWCKHIAVAEFRRDGSPITMYADPPLLKVVCTQFSYETFAGQATARRISERFRKQFCSRCGARAPDFDAASRSPDEARRRAQRNRAKTERRRLRDARK